MADHPYFGDKLDAYALTAFLLGRTERITGMVTVTNLPSRPAPVLARTLTSLSALSGGGDPVTFDGEFYHVDGLDPAAAPAPRVFTGSVGPKSLAVTGQLADGWIPPGGSDWLSQLYRESRPRVDDAASAAGRDPADIADVYNFGGRAGGSGPTSSPLPSWTTTRPASSTATQTTPPPTRPWPAGPPRSSPPSAPPSPDSPRPVCAHPRAFAPVLNLAGLVDEYQLFLVPAVVGGGTRALPDQVRLNLALAEERRFGGGTVYVCYRPG